jgi:hypothetical protein
MKYGDFSSLVQLGVGLHAGTALLQIYGEIGVQPLVRTLSRIRQLLEEPNHVKEAIIEDLDQLDADFAIFRIQLFNEYKRYVVVNFVVAAVLVGILTLISYKSDDLLPELLSVLFASLSVLPAPMTLGALWWDASRELRPLKARADMAEQRALGRQVAK